ncbi:MAG: hypothetical protein IH851_07470 [Armatimonadetes bacterium]|nr:hypothetical protein [Armatimonadota bacterium]
MGDDVQNPKIQQLVTRPIGAPTAPKKRQPADGPDFAQVLQQELDLRLSGHARTRLASRGIELARGDWERIKRGVDLAASKGSRESLVMIDEIALVISVKNRTVITAVAKEQLKENVFTNIDSAVFV